MSYKAIVTQLTNVRTHPNADRIKLATVMGNQVVVGLNANDGDVGIFFPTDGQLSEEYAAANDLVGTYVAGKKVSGGFFSEKRRVKSQSFRGEKSDGYWAEATSLAFTGDTPSAANVGTEFDTWNGVPICNKYYTPKTRQSMGGGSKKKNRGETTMFKKHFDTKQFRFYSELIPEGFITLTEKVHGTSGRYGYVLESKPERWYHRLFNREPGKEWQYLMGTRNVIVGDTPGYYGTDDFRHNAVEPLKGNLRKGEVVYFEIVGWVNETTPVMPSVKTKGLKDIEAQYGKEMSYLYNCKPGEHDLYVYRIAMVNEDGISIDLTWEQVKRRCGELGVKYVPQYGHSFNSQWLSLVDTSLQSLVEYDATGASTIDNRHIREGVCVRIDHGELEPMVLKHKSFEFGVMEGYIKTDDNYIDLEEIS